MKIKEIHKDLKKQVNIAEKERKSKRGQKTWYDLSFKRFSHQQFGSGL